MSQNIVHLCGDDGCEVLDATHWDAAGKAVHGMAENYHKENGEYPSLEWWEDHMIEYVEAMERRVAMKASVDGLPPPILSDLKSVLAVIPAIQNLARYFGVEE